MSIDISTYANLKLVTAPAVEPLDLLTAEGFHRVASDAGGPVDQDFLSLIVLARQQCETVMRRALLSQQWQLSLRSWPGRDYQNWPQGVNQGYDAYYRFDHVELPYPPLASVQSVTYTDTSGAVFTMPQGNVAGGYNVDVNFEPGRIVLPYSQIWPTTILLPGAAIQILYTCGYPDVATLQTQFEGYASTIQAMKMIIGYCYENKIPPSEMRRSSIDAGMEYVIQQLLTPFRIH